MNSISAASLQSGAVVLTEDGCRARIVSAVQNGDQIEVCFCMLDGPKAPGWFDQIVRADASVITG